MLPYVYLSQLVKYGIPTKMLSRLGSYWNVVKFAAIRGPKAFTGNPFRAKSSFSRGVAIIQPEQGLIYDVNGMKPHAIY